MPHPNSITIDPSKTLESVPTSKANTSDHVSSTNPKGTVFFKDSSKPDGDACRDDGTLKDASELEWPNSPSDSKASNTTFDDYAMQVDSETFERLNEEVSHSLRTWS
jgi:hypothetical protein